MIRVVRIAGESFDLESQKELPKALVLSNGMREYALYVDDDTAAAVLKLMLDGAHPNASMSTKAPAPTPERPVMMMPKKPSSALKHYEPVYVHENVGSPPPMVEVGGAAAEDMDDDNSESEPGEEYNDPATGAASL